MQRTPRNSAGGLHTDLPQQAAAALQGENTAARGWAAWGAAPQGTEAAMATGTSVPQWGGKAPHQGKGTKGKPYQGQQTGTPDVTSLCSASTGGSPAIICREELRWPLGSRECRLEHWESPENGPTQVPASPPLGPTDISPLKQPGHKQHKPKEMQQPQRPHHVSTGYVLYSNRHMILHSWAGLTLRTLGAAPLPLQTWDVSLHIPSFPFGSPAHPTQPTLANTSRTMQHTSPSTSVHHKEVWFCCQPTQQEHLYAHLILAWHYHDPNLHCQDSALLELQKEPCHLCICAPLPPIREGKDHSKTTPKVQLELKQTQLTDI